VPASGVRGGLDGGCRGVDPSVRGFGGSTPKKKKIRLTYFRRANIFPGRHITGTTYFQDHMILGGFLAHAFFANGFLFPVKELGFWTNPGHWVRVLDVAGSYMYIVL
jgi:hypothetical protein